MPSSSVVRTAPLVQQHAYIVSELEWDESDTEITSDIKILGCFTSRDAANECVRTWHERAYVPCARRDFDKYVVSRDPEGLLHLTVAKEWLCWEVAAEVVPVDKEFTMSLMEPGVGLDDDIGQPPQVQQHQQQQQVRTPANKARGRTGGKATAKTPTSGRSSAKASARSRRVADEEDDEGDEDEEEEVSDSEDDDEDEEEADEDEEGYSPEDSRSRTGARSSGATKRSRSEMSFNDSSYYGSPLARSPAAASNANGAGGSANGTPDPTRRKEQKRTGKPDLVQQHNRRFGGWAATKKANLEKRGYPVAKK